MERCKLKVKINENEDFQIANDKAMYLQTHNIAGHSYSMDLFV
jgi:hypothetical protein